MFEDNKLNTQSTSYEYMLTGSIMQAEGILRPTKYFLITGAFHTSNNTFDVFKKVYFNKTSDSTFGDNYRYNITNMGGAPAVYFDQKTNDGFRSLEVDPSDTAYTFIALMWQNTTTAAPVDNSNCLIGRLSRKLNYISWLKESSAYVDDCMLAISDTP